MAATGLVDNFGPPLCRVLILRGRGIAEIAPHGSEKADAKARVFSVGDGAPDVPEELETVKKVFAIFGNWHGEKAADGEDETELIRVE